MTTDTMRAEFEAWARKEQELTSEDLRVYPEGDYREYAVVMAFRAFQFAWQASAEAERGRVCPLWHDIVHCPTDGSVWEMKFSDGICFVGKWEPKAQRWMRSLGELTSPLPAGIYPVAYRALNRTERMTQQEKPE